MSSKKPHVKPEVKKPKPPPKPHAPINEALLAKMCKLWEKTDYRSLMKWKYLCEQNGMVGPYVAHFWEDYAKTDVIIPESEIKQHYIPIFSKEGGTYQFDTWDRKGHYFLILININTKKAYAYPMPQKNAMYVGGALEAFWDDVKDVKVMVSDQDSAYCSMEIQQAFRKRKIKHVTTHKTTIISSESSTDSCEL
jgi:hypothetical protein